MQSLLNHPQLMDCRRLFLRDHEVWINIGVHDFEKRGEQRVRINVDLFVPLARSSTPADIAAAVRFLIESPAITGTTLLVDGGQHLQAQPRDVLFLARQPKED